MFSQWKMKYLIEDCTLLFPQCCLVFTGAVLSSVAWSLSLLCTAVSRCVLLSDPAATRISGTPAETRHQLSHLEEEEKNPAKPPLSPLIFHAALAYPPRRQESPIGQRELASHKLRLSALTSLNNTGRIIAISSNKEDMQSVLSWNDLKQLPPFGTAYKCIDKEERKGF